MPTVSNPAAARSSNLSVPKVNVGSPVNPDDMLFTLELLIVAVVLSDLVNPPEPVIVKLNASGTL